MSWAVNDWHTAQARAVHAGLIGPRGPQHLLDLDPVHLLAFIEGIVCESEDNAEKIQQMYDDAKPKPPPPRMSEAERQAQVARFSAMIGG